MSLGERRVEMCELVGWSFGAMLSSCKVVRCPIIRVTMKFGRLRLRGTSGFAARLSPAAPFHMCLGPVALEVSKEAHDRRRNQRIFIQVERAFSIRCLSTRICGTLHVEKHAQLFRDAIR